MRYILLLLPFVYFTSLAQQKESTISISCYVNPTLYLQAGVIAHVSDKAGNISCSGRYVSIYNQSPNAFYYKRNTTWTLIKPQQRTVVSVPGAAHTSSNSPSVLKLDVKYMHDASGNIDAKVRAMTQMNAQSDEVKASELRGEKKISSQILAKNSKPATPAPVAKATPAASANKEARRKVAAKAPSGTAPKQAKPQSTAIQRRGVQQQSSASATAVGLRIEFGNGPTGIGPNIKHRFNRKASIDAAVLFFEDDWTGLGAQFERNFPVKGATGLDWYIGIGPQFFFKDEDTEVALVPVTGLEYKIPGAPLNFALDWRPNFSLSAGTDAEAGRFGLSFRLAF